MVLQKEYDTVAHWGTDRWIVEAKPRYRWADIKNRPITDWYATLEEALEYAIKPDTK